MKEQKLLFKYDPVANAAAIYLRHPILRGEVVRSDTDTPPMTSVVLEFDKEDNLVVIEILGANRLLPPELLK